jgi:hypothetical protein
MVSMRVKATGGRVNAEKTAELIVKTDSSANFAKAI